MTVANKEVQVSSAPQKSVPVVRHWVLAMAVVLIGAFMAMLDSSIVNVAIKSMMDDFQATTSQIQWVITIYMLTLGVVVPTSGWLSDYLGYKKLYIYSLVIFTLGSLLCSLAWSETILIAARVVQAVGGGMVMPVTMSMMYALVPKEKIGSAMGFFGMTMLVAPALGPTLGGYLVEYINWRWIFTINLPIGIIGVFLAIAIIPKFPGKPAGKFDVAGSLLSGGGLFSLLLALSQGEDWGWTSLSIVMLLFGSFCLLALFVVQELTTDAPLLNLRVFKYKDFSLGNLMLIIITIGMYGGLFYIPLFLQSYRGLGAMKVGMLQLPPALVSGIMLPVSGKIYDKYGPRLIISAGIGFLAYGTWLLMGIDMDTPLSSIILWNCVRSVGMGMTMMPVQTALMSSLPHDEVGRGSAITNIISRVSGSFGLALLTLILTKRQAYHIAYLSWTVSATNLTNLIQSGVDSATASTLVAKSLATMSFVQSMSDIFLFTMVITLVAFFPVFFLHKAKSKAKNDAEELSMEAALVD